MPCCLAGLVCCWLIHRYRVFSRAGTHVTFRGTYMTKLRNFLSIADLSAGPE